MKCDRCGFVNKAMAKFCTQCGNSLNTNRKKCPKCSRLLPIAANFCSGCGHRFQERGSVMMKKVHSKDGKFNKCLICQVEIINDMTACPECANIFHYNHLINWLLSPESESRCPVCKAELVLENP